MTRLSTPKDAPRLRHPPGGRRSLLSLVFSEAENDFCGFYARVPEKTADEGTSGFRACVVQNEFGDTSVDDVYI